MQVFGLESNIPYPKFLYQTEKHAVLILSSGLKAIEAIRNMGSDKLPHVILKEKVSRTSHKKLFIIVF